jgi:LPS export ABC transporter permease LptG/LPS export ABC transporter permease LptF
MLRILDRYVIREVLAPFGLALSLFTFILLVDPLMKEAQRLIEKGVGAVTILRILATLMPQALGITIPVALLVGLLIGLGRLSADREAVALQACGVSLTRLLRPVAACAVAACLATGYVMIWAMPAGNQHYQALLAEIVAARIATEIKPRVFFEDFPNLTFYSRDVASDGAGWRDVFVADRRNADRPQFLLAARGRLVIDEKARSVDLTLWDGSSHRADPKDPAKYEVQRFVTQTVKLDANDIFPKTAVMHGAPEMTISELQAEIVKKQALNQSPHNEVMYLHQKFAFPAACLVFGLLALSLGVSNSKDSKHASFVVGLAVVFVFYALMMIGSSLTKAHVFPASLARWLPNIVLGLAGIALLIYRHRHADAGVQIRLPSMATIRDAIERRLPWRRQASPAVEASAAAAREAQSQAQNQAQNQAPRQAKAVPAKGSRPAKVVLVLRVPRAVVDLVRLPRPTLLDAYVGKAYLRVLLLAFAGLLGIFYIGSFIDWSDNLFKGQATAAQLAQYMWYSTPQFVYYVLPLSALVGTLVTIGLLTKSSELIVMRACGVSLYRTALPLLVLGLLWSGLLFGLEESFLASSNRKAAELKHLMRGGAPRTFDVLARQWVAGRDGRIYRYTYFDPRAKTLTGLDVFRFQEKPWGLAESVTVRSASYQAADSTWLADQGSVRRFANNVVTEYTPIAEKVLIFEAASYFGTEQPDADRLSFTNLRRYIAALRVSGFDVVPYRVALHRKIAFPFVALVMTLIAIPFAVTMGRRGALFGIGLGLLLAISYWGLSAVFSAIGGAGLLAPPLAAWAPNVLFISAASYLLLTVRT